MSALRDLEFKPLLLADVSGGLLLGSLKVLPIAEQEQSNQTSPRLLATILRRYMDHTSTLW